jgi:hypothetical protein
MYYYVFKLISPTKIYILCPEWWDVSLSKNEPSDPDLTLETIFFKLKKINKPLFKYMSSKLSKGLQIDPIGAHHCNQTSPQIVYELIPISESELIHMSISGGRGKYTQKRKKQGHMLKKRNK